MKNKTSAVPSRIWTFGCLGPVEGAELVSQQLRLSHEYYNALTVIENERRAAYREARRNFAPSYEKVESREAEVATSLREARVALLEFRRQATARVKAESKKSGLKFKPVRVANPEMEATIKTLDDEVKELRAKLKVMREKFKTNKKFNRIVVRLNEASNERHKEVRAKFVEAGLFWGPYLLVDKAIEGAAERSKSDIQARRGSGIEGRVGVQLQARGSGEDRHFLSTTDFMSGKEHSFLKLEAPVAGTDTPWPLPSTQWDTRSGRRSAYATVCLRAGSTENRKPIWIKFPVLIHRKPPEGVIKWAWIKVKKIGTQTTYELQLSIESRAFAQPPKGKGAVAVWMGWRQMSHPKPGNKGFGIRVGYAVDDNGNTMTCDMTDTMVDHIRYADTLREIGDLVFNTARDVLTRELRTDVEVPAWVRTEAATVAHWRSHAKLARLAGRLTYELFKPEQIEALWSEWKRERLAKGLDLFSQDYETHEAVIRDWGRSHGLTKPVESLALYLEWWRRKNRHLYQWECDQRVKSHGWRDETFRIFASKLAKTYETIIVRDMSFAKIARREAPESDTVIPERVRANRQLAAPGKLRSSIVSAVGESRVIELTYRADKPSDDNATQSDVVEPATIAKAMLDLYFESFGAAAAE